MRRPVDHVTRPSPAIFFVTNVSPVYNFWGIRPRRKSIPRRWVKFCNKRHNTNIFAKKAYVPSQSWGIGVGEWLSEKHRYARYLLRRHPSILPASRFWRSRCRNRIQKRGNGRVVNFPILHVCEIHTQRYGGLELGMCPTPTRHLTLKAGYIRAASSP